jgi:hypothetical protein
MDKEATATAAAVTPGDPSEGLREYDGVRVTLAFDDDFDDDKILLRRGVAPGEVTGL